MKAEPDANATARKLLAMMGGAYRCDYKPGTPDDQNTVRPVVAAVLADGQVDLLPHKMTEAFFGAGSFGKHALAQFIASLLRNPEYDFAYFILLTEAWVAHIDEHDADTWKAKVEEGGVRALPQKINVLLANIFWRTGTSVMYQQIDDGNLVGEIVEMRGGDKSEGNMVPESLRPDGDHVH